MYNQIINMFIILFKIWFCICLVLALVGLIIGFNKLHTFLKQTNELDETKDPTLFVQIKQSFSYIKGLFIWTFAFVLVCHILIYSIIMMFITFVLNNITIYCTINIPI